jgi:hypothetical protein
VAPAYGQGARKFQIQSAFDTFELVLTNKNNGTVDGKPANLKPLDDLWPVLNNPIGNACPGKLGAPDITVKENGKARMIYVKSGMVSDGKSCLNVGGDGLLYFPVHREFFIGPKKDSIALKSPLKIFRQGVKLLEIKKDGKHWVTENPEALLNWDFLERVENSLKDFDVRLRVQLDIAKNKSKMIIQSGDQTYEFYKVTGVMWAVRKPGSNWLVASDDWSFWYDFDQQMIEDRFAPEIRTLSKAGVAQPERKQAMDRLGDGWSRNLRDLYHKILLDSNEDSEFKRTALNRLKRKPSEETSAVVAQFLSQSDNEDLKVLAGQVLRLHNPKGPAYKKNLPESEKAKVIEFWNNSAKPNQKGN